MIQKLAVQLKHLLYQSGQPIDFILLIDIALSTPILYMLHGSMQLKNRAVQIF